MLVEAERHDTSENRYAIAVFFWQQGIMINTGPRGFFSTLINHHACFKSYIKML
jgi:hypothetical protein